MGCWLKNTRNSYRPERFNLLREDSDHRRPFGVKIGAAQGLYFLESKGISSGRLSAIGYGEYRPVASNSTREGRQLNRRVEILVLPKSVKKLGADLEDSEDPAEEELLK